MKIKTYVKRPIAVQAIQLEPKPESQAAVLEFCKGKALEGKEGTVAIETLEGIMIAQIGDYVIRGVKGEFYPCKPDIFEKSYSEA